jgi:hypothetical protein
MWRIFVPLRYLQIDHPEKRKFDLWLPFLLTAIFALPLISEQFRHDAIGGRLVVGKVGEFLGVLTGFFIAALAAVATFGKSEMDDPMPGEPPVRLEHKKNRQVYFENLSRRRFLSFLFGYMAFVTLALYILGYGYLIADKYFILPCVPEVRSWFFATFWIAYTFALGNILSNTLLGLFYLTDRIHRPNKLATWKGKKPASDHGDQDKSMIIDRDTTEEDK